MWCAFLKGINVGGTHKVPMAALRETLADAGLCDVRTYIQSGNVAFEQPKRPLSAATISAAINARFGFEVPVVLRSLDEMAAIERSNPFLDSGEDPSLLHVIFLDAEPAPAAVKTLDHDRSPPDEFVVSGTEIFLRYPNGSARSKLNADYFERVLGVTATARNWNTLLKMVSMIR